MLLYCYRLWRQASCKFGIDVLMIGNDTGTNWMILRYFRDALSKRRYELLSSYYRPTLILNPLLRLLFFRRMIAGLDEVE